MINPQKENGNTQIANEILDHLINSGLNGTELSCVLFIIRKTYGWNKKTDCISLSQFVLNTHRTKQAICRALKKLLVNKMILLVNKTLLGNEYSFNKRYTQWVVNKTLLVNKTIIGSKQNDNLVVNKTLHTKDTITKDNIQKTIVASDKSLRLSKGLLNCIIFNNENFKHNKNTVPRWALDIDKMIRIDKRDPKEIEQVIRFAQSDSFWKSNILSGAKLRKQFDSLWIQAKENFNTNTISVYD